LVRAFSSGCASAACAPRVKERGACWADQLIVAPLDDADDEDVAE
jgi:hypothetical protein